MTDHNIDEDRRIEPDELLDWLCWCAATSGERFYPPTETAEECAEAMASESEDTAFDDVYERELGKHQRAYMDAFEFFHDLENHGYDPKGRAQRYIEVDDTVLDDIDWSWWEDRG